MARQWRRRVDAKTPIQIEIDGMKLLLQPTTPKSKAEAIALAGDGDIFGKNAFEAAQKSAKALDISLERMLFRLSEEAPEDRRAIGSFMRWMSEVRACNAAAHTLSIEIDGVIHPAPSDLVERRAWFDTFDAVDDEGATDYEAREALLEAIEGALTGTSILSDEGKG